MTSSITLSMHLAGVACLRRGRLIASVRGVGLKVIAMRLVGSRSFRLIEASSKTQTPQLRLVNSEIETLNTRGPKFITGYGNPHILPFLSNL